MIRIEMQNVCLGYSHKTVLRDITFQVSPGELVGLIGPNGCGKSTIIRAFSHIILPSSGKVLLDSRDIRHISRRELAQLVGVVPQLPILPSSFTAFEIVLMGRNPHLGLFQYEGPKEMELAWEAMARTGTQELAKRRVNELSGGEIQCLLIARVLAQETRVILLDEPTANLDIGRQLDVLDLIKRLCGEKKSTVLAAIHDLNLAAQYCDRLVMINDGRIHAIGTPTEVITKQNVEEVYGADNCVFPHPINKLPTVLLNTRNGKPKSADLVRGS